LNRQQKENILAKYCSTINILKVQKHGKRNKKTESTEVTLDIEIRQIFFLLFKKYRNWITRLCGTENLLPESEEAKITMFGHAERIQRRRIPGEESEYRNLLCDPKQEGLARYSKTPKSEERAENPSSLSGTGRPQIHPSIHPSL
jgi:hypothetical protein